MLTPRAAQVGACERISSQPLPLAYTRHTSRVLVVWLTFLVGVGWVALESVP